MDASETPVTPGRSEGQWAPPVSQLHVEGDGAGGDVGAVEGRELNGPMQGFGKLWQKTFRVRLDGSVATPQEVITAWKANFGDFWPSNNLLHAPLAGITPGEVALITGKMPGGLTLSTGVYVIYSDDVSFSYMTPQGHPWAAMITFSAEETDGGSCAQVQLLIRSFDPFTEMAMPIFGHRMEDNMWVHTLASLAGHFGVSEPEVTKERVCVDKKRQWKHFRNWRRSSGIYAMTRPFRRRSKPVLAAPDGMTGEG